MSKSRRLSIASAPCRIEWRPSRWVGAWLHALVVLVPLAVLASGLPRGLAWTLASAGALRALVLARRYMRQPARHLVVPTGRGRPNCDGDALHAFEASWRGPLAFLRWRDLHGRRQHAAFWPDTLDEAGRRELRLALMRMEPAPKAASMAG